MNRDEKGLYIKGHTSGMTGKHHSEETKKKIKESNTGISSTLKGTTRPPFSKEWIENLRKSHLGHKVSDETKKKLSDVRKKEWANGDRKPFGPMSKEHKEKISASLKKISDELSIVRKGRVPWNKGLRGYGAGEKHYNWKGGITSENRKYRNCAGFKLWRENVFDRDNYVCQKCKAIGGILHPHHISNFSTNIELRFIAANGITLCKSCHKEFHHKYGTKDNNKKQLNEFLTT